MCTWHIIQVMCLFSLIPVINAEMIVILASHLTLVWCYTSPVEMSKMHENFFIVEYGFIGYAVNNSDHSGQIRCPLLNV